MRVCAPSWLQAAQSTARLPQHRTCSCSKAPGNKSEQEMLVLPSPYRAQFTERERRAYASPREANRLPCLLCYCSLSRKHITKRIDWFLREKLLLFPRKFCLWNPKGVSSYFPPDSEVGMMLFCHHLLKILQPRS